MVWLREPPSECGFTKEKARGTNLTPDLDAFADAASPPRAGLLVKLQDDHLVSKMICMDFP